MKTRFEFGRDILGPLFFSFCSRLHLFLGGNADRAALFAARGGMRLRILYNLYREAYGFASPCPQANFLVSRFSAAAACLSSDFEYVADIVAREFRYSSVGEVIHFFAPDCGCDGPEELTSAGMTVDAFRAAYFDPAFAAARDFHRSQNELLRKHIDECSRGVEKLVLVDTGWGGSIQSILMRSFPERDWLGAYVGRWDPRRANPWHFYSVCGLIVEGCTPADGSPEAGIFCNQHIVEDPMEPPCESVTFYSDAGGSVTSNLDANCDPLALKPEDAHFSGILEYFGNAGPIPFHDVQSACRTALRRLRKTLMYPGRADVPLAASNPRSWDYGRNGDTKCVVLDAGHSAFSKKIDRIRHSIWKQGQARVEFGRLAILFLLLYNNEFIRKLFKLDFDW